jgi:hypothetical protein
MDPEQRTHNPLVLGSNPSGPTNQPVEATAVRRTGAATRQGLIGQLKLFSQLFEAKIHSSGTSQRRIGGDHSDKSALSVFQNHEIGSGVLTSSERLSDSGGAVSGQTRRERQ